MFQPRFAFLQLRTSVSPPRVLTRSFTLIPAVSIATDSVQLLGFSFNRSLTLACNLYTISVRQARALPIGGPFNLRNPASFRFHLTMDTLAFGCTLPTAGRVRVSHPLERALAGRSRKKGLSQNDESIVERQPQRYFEKGEQKGRGRLALKGTKTRAALWLLKILSMDFQYS